MPLASSFCSDPRRRTSLRAWSNYVECGSFRREEGAWVKCMPREIRELDPGFVPP